MALKWKVYVKVYGETTYCTNAISYDSKELADIAGSDLFSLWLAVEKWETREVEVS